MGKRTLYKTHYKREKSEEKAEVRLWKQMTLKDSLCNHYKNCWGDLHNVFRGHVTSKRESFVGRPAHHQQIGPLQPHRTTYKACQEKTFRIAVSRQKIVNSLEKKNPSHILFHPYY